MPWYSSVAPDEVGEQERAQVPDVGVAVDGRPAGVHPDPVAVAGLDGLDCTAERVPEATASPRES